jgi:hypothetical protein
METRHAVLALVLVVTAVMVVRGAVAVDNGAFGTAMRQGAVGAIVLTFGVAIYQQWDTLG